MTLSEALGEEQAAGGDDEPAQTHAPKRPKRSKNPAHLKKRESEKNNPAGERTNNITRR
jgi:hypothetical protein